MTAREEPLPSLAVARQVSGASGLSASFPISINVDGVVPERSSVWVHGLSPGTVLSAGHSAGSGAWILSPDELEDLRITPGRDAKRDTDLVVQLAAPNGSVSGERRTRLAIQDRERAYGTLSDRTPSDRVKAEPKTDLKTATEPEVQGVTKGEIIFGMASAFSGAAKESGENLKIGVEAAFAQVNEAGGIYGRRLKLIAVDDGYEPTRTIQAMKTLDEQDKVFGFIGNFGTATAMVAAPYALEHKMLFFGAFSGATVLRRDPPDRYVFNYRPGYADETDAVVKYLVMVRRIAPAQIAVFAQDDGFGEAGVDGVRKAMRELRGEQAPDVLVMKYKRNAIDISDAMQQFTRRRKTIKAVVMVATYRAAARFVEKTHDLVPNLIYTDVSGVGSTSFADELMLLGPTYANGVVVTQIVPAADSYASAILEYRKALANYSPGSKPDYVSLEGFVDAKLLIAGLKKAGPGLTTERLVDALEEVTNLDMGLGTILSFGPSKHQASSKVWGTMLDEKGHFQPLDFN